MSNLPSIQMQKLITHLKLNEQSILIEIGTGLHFEDRKFMKCIKFEVFEMKNERGRKKRIVRLMVILKCQWPKINDEMSHKV